MVTSRNWDDGQTIGQTENIYTSGNRGNYGVLSLDFANNDEYWITFVFDNEAF